MRQTAEAATTPARTSLTLTEVANAARVVLTYWQALIAIVGLLTYGVVDLAYEEFYRQLGTTPHAVGIDRVVVLTEAGEFLLVFLVSVVLLAVALAVISRARRKSTRIAGATMLAVATLAVAVWYGPWMAEAMLPVLACLAIVIIVVLRELNPSTAGSAWHAPLAAFFGIAAIFLTLWVSAQRGIELAQAVQKSHSLRKYDTFLELQADPVCVGWSDGKRPPTLPPNTAVAYLGENGDHLILYNYERQSPVMVPSANTTLVRAQVVGGNLSCKS